jgi:hypothetical protein
MWNNPAAKLTSFGGYLQKLEDKVGSGARPLQSRFGAYSLIVALLRCPAPLENEVVIVSSLSAYSQRFWHPLTAFDLPQLARVSGSVLRMDTSSMEDSLPFPTPGTACLSK